MATPNITLTATLLDFSGAEIGSTASPAYLRIALCGFGPELPTVPGTAMIGNIASWPGDIPYTGAPLTGGTAIKLWGNDQISPAGTYYMIAVLDAKKNVIQSALYVFTGTQTVDLSSALPMAAGYLVGAVPNGPLPGSAFQLPTPLKAGGAAGAAFWYGGLLQDQGDYTLNGAGLQPGFTCQPGDTLFVSYVGAQSGAGLPMQLWTAIANGVFPGNAYTLPTAPPGAQLVGVFYNGGFLLPAINRSGKGPDYAIAGQNLALNFMTDAPDPVTGKNPSLTALYAVGAAAITVEEPSGAYPGSAYTMSAAALAGQLIGLWYDPLFQRPGVDYTVSGDAIALKFNTEAGDCVYVAYIPV